LRNSGVDTGGPAAINQKNLNDFANHLNKWISNI